MIGRVPVDGEMRKYLLEKTKGREKIEVLYPKKMPRICVNPPTCELGQVLVDIFGAWPRMG